MWTQWHIYVLLYIIEKQSTLLNLNFIFTKEIYFWIMIYVILNILCDSELPQEPTKNIYF